MSYNMLITHIEDGTSKSFDVSEIVHNIEYTTSLESQAGRLTFMLEKDLSNSLVISIGSFVQFFSNKRCIFYGKIFTIETDSTDVYRVVAYDFLRYLKNSDSILVENENGDNTRIRTLRELFDDIVSVYNISGIKGKMGKWADTVDLQPLDAHYFSNNTHFEILQYYMSIEGERLAKSAKTKSPYLMSSDLVARLYLKCNLDTIELREIMYDFLYDENGNRRTTFLQIGDESLMTDYTYKVDIDNEVYNRLIFVYNQKKTDESTTGETSESTNTQVSEKQIIAAMDAGHVISNTGSSLDGTKIGENTMSKWGILSKVIEVKNIEPSNVLDEYMKACLEVYSQPNRTLRLNAVGYDGVEAGSGFYLHINKLDANYPVYVISATHRYDADEHMMELEISTNIGMRLFV